MVDVPTTAPSEQGIDPAGLLALVDALDEDPQIEPHGLIVQRHGHRVLEGYWSPHQPGQLRLIYSLSKSLTGIALALAVGDGRVALDDLVADHLPDLMDGADARTRRMRVRHLASMATGHDREMLLDAFAADPSDVVRGFLRLPPPHEPGAVFAYNQPPVLTLATVLHRLTGRRLVDDVRARVLEPLGVTDLRWQQYRPGLDLAFSGAYADLDAVARLGQLHLDDGAANGRHLLPRDWVSQASRPQVATPHEPEPDWRQGYGYLLWRSRHGYRGDGGFGQYMVVLPDHDTVVALFTHTEPMQRVLDHLWSHLLPAIDASWGRSATATDDELSHRLSTLRLPTAGERTRATGDVTRIPDGEFRAAPPHARSQRTITTVEVRAGELLVHEADGVTHIPLTAAWSEAPDLPAAASAAVDEVRRTIVDIALLATPHRLVLTLDPVTSTFDATWPAVPMFGAGPGESIATMRPPPS